MTLLYNIKQGTVASVHHETIKSIGRTQVKHMHVQSHTRVLLSQTRVDCLECQANGGVAPPHNALSRSITAARGGVTSG